VTSTPSTSITRRVGPFYLLAVWRKGLTLIAGVIAIAVGLVVSDVPYSIARAICSGFAAANITNYSYYLHVIRHSRSWNFREGFGPSIATV
jgi:hypothetical protein